MSRCVRARGRVCNGWRIRWGICSCRGMRNSWRVGSKRCVSRSVRFCRCMSNSRGIRHSGRTRWGVRSSWRSGGTALSERYIIYVAHVSASCLGVKRQPQDMLTRSEGNIGDGHGLPGLPAVRIGDGDRAAHIHAVHFHVQNAAAMIVGEPQVQRVGSGRCHVHGVFRPLAGFDVAHIVTAAGVRCRFNIHAFTCAVSLALIRGGRIVISNSLPAVVEIFRLNGSGDRPRGAAIRGLPGGYIGWRGCFCL